MDGRSRILPFGGRASDARAAGPFAAHRKHARAGSQGFQELDKEILSLNRRLVAAKLFARQVPVGQRAQSTRDYTDNQMLDHQTSLQKPRIALRRLFGNAGAAIRAYKPCIMMSPMSVAQYLEPGNTASTS